MKTIIQSIILCFLSYSITAQCYTDRHNTSSDEAWITCNKIESPNPIRGNSQWIMYDLEIPQQLGQIHIWNINAVDKTAMGIKEAVLDYSTDGITWFEWGTFELEEAPSSGFYEGQSGPNLTGTDARFILITVLDNHGNICSGLSEIRIESFGEVSNLDNVELTDATISAHPNPASDFTLLSVTLERPQSISVALLDLSGKKVIESNHDLFAGQQDIKIPFDNIPDGQYVLNVDNGQETKSLNITIVNP